MIYLVLFFYFARNPFLVSKSKFYVFNLLLHLLPLDLATMKAHQPTDSNKSRSEWMNFLRELSKYKWFRGPSLINFPFPGTTTERFFYQHLLLILLLD